jgi:hypothetical protein
VDRPVRRLGEPQGVYRVLRVGPRFGVVYHPCGRDHVSKDWPSGWANYRQHCSVRWDPQSKLTNSAALFGLFTFSMFITHLTLIRNNTSTVESFAVKDQAERERYVLQREFGFCGGFAKKRAVRRRWDQEWGGLSVDGRWRTGNDMREVMGDKWWMWIRTSALRFSSRVDGHKVPIGRPKGDGIHFVQDGRFGPNGEWLPKAQWPAQ